MPKDIICKSIMGDFDYSRYRKLRQAYVKACNSKLSELTFEAHTWGVTFIGYVLEYLQRQFSNK